ncbi:hypothetical protein AB0M10_33950 [Streptomyces sp. NPDC051840]|uniref:hypothetical protein n=1 Tax=Streptomyces sp. NPDC051840 TaxID=3154752 RepID=UPI003413BA9C
MTARPGRPLKTALVVQVDLPHPEQWTQTFGVSGRAEIATDVGNYVKTELLHNSVFGTGEVSAEFELLHVPYVQRALAHHFFPERDFSTKSTLTVFLHIVVTLSSPSEWTRAHGEDVRAEIADSVRAHVAETLVPAGVFSSGGVEAVIVLRDTPFVRKVLSWREWPDGILHVRMPAEFREYTMLRLRSDLLARLKQRSGLEIPAPQIVELGHLVGEALRREIRDVDPELRWHKEKGVLSAADEPELTDAGAVARLWDQVIDRYVDTAVKALASRA